MKKLNRLFERVCTKKESFIDLANEDKGYFTDGEPFQELGSWYKKFMKDFKIGTEISKGFWGSRKTKEIQNILAKNVKKTVDDNRPTAPSALKLHDNLKKDVKSKDHSNAAFARVAKHETANIRSAYSLMSFQKAGIEEVKYTNRNLPNVSKACKALNNRIFKIKDLMPGGRYEKFRIPNVHINCRCHFKPVIKGYVRGKDPRYN